MTPFDSLLDNDEKQESASGVMDSDGLTHRSTERSPHIIAVTSGKGGVGKTNVVANLSVGLSELGRKVVVLDADFGLANLDVLLGLAPRYHLGHVLYGDKSLHEVMVPGPKGIHIIPASSGLQQMSELTQAQRRLLIDSFTHLDMDIDYFIIDTAAGISRNVIQFLLAAQEVFVVSAPEPTAIVDAYAIIKVVLAEDREKPIRVIINSVEKVADAHEVFCQINSVVKRFLNREIDYLGHIERDSHVPQAVKNQMPVICRFPNSPASICFRDLACRIAQGEESDPMIEGMVWEKLLNDWVN